MHRPIQGRGICHQTRIFGNIRSWFSRTGYMTMIQDEKGTERRTEFKWLLSGYRARSTLMLKVRNLDYMRISSTTEPRPPTT